MMRKLGETILISSGAIGTCLQGAGAGTGGPVEILNIRDPGSVRALHTMYKEAGAQILVTNTFAANPLLFGDADLGEYCHETNKSGVEIAKGVAGDNCMVWASMGPLSLGLRLDDFADDDLANIYREQCAELTGADALLLETFTAPREAAAALAAAKETGMPVIFQIGNTGRGARQWERIDALLSEACKVGVTAIGANCRHPGEIVHVASYIAAHTDLPVTASANAGHPSILRGAVTYDFTPEQFAIVAGELAANGVAVIGGCCGTSPDHVRLLARMLQGRPVEKHPSAEITVASVRHAPVQLETRANPIRNLMQSSQFLISVEIRADRMQSADEIIKGSSRIAEAGADIFDVPDNPGATVGRDAMVTAARLQETVGIPSISHLSVTQSNLMRLHSTLIGSWDLGLRGVLAITGDSPGMGHLGNMAHRVSDLKSSVELLRLIRQLRDGRMINGESVADPPDLCAGCAFGQGTTAQVKWLARKADAGAEFVFSQPIFTFEDYEQLRDAIADIPVRFFPGLMPLVSKRSAEALASGRIPGIVVPHGIVEELARYTTAKDQRRQGLDMAMQLAMKIAEDARGLYLIMPFGKRCYEESADIVHAVRNCQ